MVDGPLRSEGELTSWNDDRGFGFITPTDGSPRIFVHISAFPRESARPVLGEAVSFETETGDDGRIMACRVRGERLAPKEVPRPVRPEARGRRGSADFLAIIAFVVVYVVTSLVWPMPPWVGGVYVVTSVLSFFVYAVDKRAATAGRWRISESSLLALGIIGGWPGAIVGQQVYRHKTRKASFRSAFWGTVALNAVAFVAFSALLSAPLRAG
jgi:uncharacterized membrane protein YsdA (DUF1294 family)/cold shock CspA family protein